MERRTAIMVTTGLLLLAGALWLIRNSITGGQETGGSPSPTATHSGICSDRSPGLVIAKEVRDRPFPMELDPASGYTARLATSCGDIVITLDPRSAPVATNNFIELLKRRWYNGTTFYGGPPGAVLAGDPSGPDGTGPGYTIDDEETRPPAVGDVVVWRETPDNGGSEIALVIEDGALAQVPEGSTVFGSVDAAGLSVARMIERAVAEGDKVWILGSRVEESAA